MLASWCGQQELVSENVEELKSKIENMHVHAPGMEDVLKACLQTDPSKRLRAEQIAAMPFWAETPNSDDNSAAQAYLQAYDDYTFAEPKHIEDPEVFMFPGYSGLKLNQFHFNVLIQIGKEFHLSLGVLNEIALLANIGLVYKARVLVCAAAYIGLCIFTDARVSIHCMAKLARLSRECMKHVVDKTIRALGGCLLPADERRHIFSSDDWAPVQTALKKHFD